MTECGRSMCGQPAAFQRQAVCLAFSSSVLICLLGTSCALPEDDYAEEGVIQQPLSGAARRPRAATIRDVAAARGLTNGVLLAGIAQVETGLSHCWSEATWACQGPFSSYCGGPVIAGAGDGPCSAQQGGLGLFQFDGGTYAQTLARDGHGILQLDGNISHAVDFLVNIVNQEVAGVDTAAEAIAWMNSVPAVAGNARFSQWTAILACRYNGRCGSADQARLYRDATLSVQSEFGAAFWTAAGGVPHSIAVGDLNNDGKNDLTGRLSNSDVWFSPNIGGGNGITWGTGWLIAGGSGFTDIAVGDLNNDGKNDLTGRLSNGDVWFSPNVGGGNGITWGTGWLIAGGSGFTDIAVGDLNNDGKKDLIGRLSNGDVWFSPNVGGGNGITWGTGWLIAGGSGFTDIAVGDLNNDGKNDLIGRLPNGDVWFTPNIGGGNGITWGTGWLIAGGSGFTDIAVGDLNNDGKNDLIGRLSNGDVWFTPNIGGGNGITWGTGWLIAGGSGF
jgi:hypothetical protein